MFVGTKFKRKFANYDKKHLETYIIPLDAVWTFLSAKKYFFF